MIRSIDDLDLINDWYRAQRSDKRTTSPLRSEKSKRISPYYNPKHIKNYAQRHHKQSMQPQKPNGRGTNPLSLSERETVPSS